MLQRNPRGSPLDKFVERRGIRALDLIAPDAGGLHSPAARAEHVRGEEFDIDPGVGDARRGESLGGHAPQGRKRARGRRGVFGGGHERHHITGGRSTEPRIRGIVTIAPTPMGLA